ncbi:MAG: hypothetical protein WCD19_04565 [Nitrososphaeraceae archaeon]
MKNSKMQSLTLATILIAALGSTSMLFASTLQYSNAQEEKNVVRDSQIILLEGMTLPPKDYIHLYDTTPYLIKLGHIAAKLPCDSNNKTSLNVLIGQAPALKPAGLELIKELSKPGTMCIYHVDIESGPPGVNLITDIALQNPTDNEVKFGPTATVVIGVDEISPVTKTGESMGNMSMGNSTH